MNEKILQLLDNHVELYPHELELHFPRILNRIVELWDSKDAEAYFNDLMIDNRGGRQGFPPKVASDIIHLNLACLRQHAVKLEVLPTQPEDIWEGDAPASRDVIDRGGIPYSQKSLLDAAESDDVEATRDILSRNLDSLNSMDDRHWTPLIVAAFRGHDQVARLLMEHGADMSAQDKSGYTALHWAAYNGQSRTARLLLQEHANINARSHSGWTPLMHAAASGHLPLTILLLDRGADINLASQDGSTALTKAAANGHVEVVKLLLKHGADPKAELRDGSSAFALATRNGHSDVAAILEHRT